jgi:outer membrane protein
MTGVVVALLAAARIVTLDDAVQSAREHQPQLRQARAQTDAASARARAAFAPLLPQVSATAGYQWTTHNAINRPGSASVPGTTGSWDLANSLSDSITASQLLFDFFSQPNRYRATKAQADAQAATERATALQIDFNVRAAYFDTRANAALAQVARENLDNQIRHLQQTEGFVQAGTRAEIDLVQARTDTANARVALINAENAYQTSKLNLNAAMGVQGPTDYDVADTQAAPVPGEDGLLDALLEEANRTRPELQSLEDQIRAELLTVRSIEGQYGPAISATAGLTQGRTGFLDRPGWNVAFGLSLTWNLFQGGLTRAQVSEAEANVIAAVAQLDLQRQQIRSDVDGARLAVRAAKESLSATQEALTNARQRLRLAEERYTVGVGSAIELGDAQVALAQSAAQAVQADDKLSTARAQLLRALGRQ